MSDDRHPVILSAGDPSPTDLPHVRTIVLQPRGPLGKMLLAAAFIGAGVLLFTVGVALALTLATVAVVTGLGVVAYRAVAGPARAGILERPLDPRKEIQPGRQEPEG